MSSSATTDARPVIPVACGVLVRPGGEVLIAQRPAGKIAAGKWEFPGGKMERGESPREALVRELHEELGIEVRTARPLIRVTHDYSDRTVILDTWLITGWQGELLAREQQAFAWCRPQRLCDYDLLGADKPIVNALRLPVDYVFTPPSGSEKQILRGLEELPRGALLRLRLPALDSSAYEKLAIKVIECARVREIRVMLDRAPQQVQALGAAGWHASVAQLARLRERPLPDDRWFSASAHNMEELGRAKQLGVDCVVLGPVQITATHPGQATLGWAEFSRLATLLSLPVYAIGGVGPGDHALVHAHYGQGAAGIRAYWSFSS